MRPGRGIRRDSPNITESLGAKASQTLPYKLIRKKNFIRQRYRAFLSYHSDFLESSHDKINYIPPIYPYWGSL